LYQDNSFLYVNPAASFAMMAKKHGAYVVEINYDETPISDIVDISIRGKSGEILPEIVRVVVTVLNIFVGR